MKKETFLNINGKSFKAIIEYKRMKYIRWNIRDNVFYIRCPYGTSKTYLENALSNYKYKTRPKLPEPFTNEYCYIFGEKQYFNACFVKINGHYILFNKETFYEDIKPIFKDYIETRLRYFENVMGIKTHYLLSIKKVKSIYGSNSKSSHKITINSFLIHFSKDIIDSIIIHELAHDFQRNHSSMFYEIVYKYCPNYDYLQHKLKKIYFRS